MTIGMTIEIFWQALRKLCLYMPLWKDPSAYVMRISGSDAAQMVMEDMPHVDDILAAVSQRLHGDTDDDVRDAAQVCVCVCVCACVRVSVSVSVAVAVAVAVAV
jgi:hypothetical protein